MKTKSLAIKGAKNEKSFNCKKLGKKLVKKQKEKNWINVKINSKQWVNSKWLYNPKNKISTKYLPKIIKL